ncbi:hypothetical protein QR680_018768 [Steinernema hermaphroditum]|uniref:Uncharacterized protein n=1 Tax=Steinernema hermaphroditum TaxID=289476 RepID=A0AA39HIY1_9BILA|nr:hypothetical protein QR680_018768 [Steinernema hermaphroditum]
MQKLVSQCERWFLRRNVLSTLRDKARVIVTTNGEDGLHFKKTKSGAVMRRQGQKVVEFCTWCETGWWASLNDDNGVPIESTRQSRRMEFKLGPIKHLWAMVQDPNVDYDFDQLVNQLFCTAIHELCHCIQNKGRLDAVKGKGAKCGPAEVHGPEF